MDDSEIVSRIGELVAEERELRRRAVGTGLDDAAAERLRHLEQHLDQYWDLLRQRKAHEEFDENPDSARQRPPDEVESYLQ